jgi:low affinity Fe/Cu permease
MEEIFRRLAQHISKVMGSMWIFFLAILIVVIWLVTGPVFGFSTNWQLAINSFTTVVTFLMVFLIQNTQNRDTKAVHIKLDELLRAMKGTRPKLLDTDELSDKELEKLHQEFIRMSKSYETALNSRKKKEEPAKIIK